MQNYSVVFICGHFHVTSRSRQTSFFEPEKQMSNCFVIDFRQGPDLGCLYLLDEKVVSRYKDHMSIQEHFEARTFFVKLVFGLSYDSARLIYSDLLVSCRRLETIFMQYLKSFGFL